MTETSRHWAGTVTGDAGPYTDANDSELDQDLNSFSDGALAGVDNELRVSVTAPASKAVLVNTGSGVVQGRFYNNSAAVTLTIADNASGQDRIDLIVLEADYVTQTVRAVVVQGVPAGAPVAPSPTQTAGVLWQEPLAEVEADNGFASIVAADIKDRRSWANIFSGASLKNNSGAPVAAGGVVMVDSTADSAVDTTTTASDGRVVDAAVYGGDDGENLALPMNHKIALEADMAVTRGDRLAAATTAGEVTVSNNASFAVALETIAGAGPILSLLLNRPSAPYAHTRRNNGGAYTYTGAAFADVDAVNLALTLVTNGGPVLIFAQGYISNNAVAGNNLVAFDFDVDGARLGVGFANGLVNWHDYRQDHYSGVFVMGLATALAAGSHVFKLQWACPVGTVSFYSAAATSPITFGAIEL